MDRLSVRGVLSLLLAAVICLLGGAIATAGLENNPANSRHLINKPIEDPRYDSSHKCRDYPPKGMKAFQNWLQKNIRGETWGIMRCESWGGGNYSVHAEGRAIDWHLDARNTKDNRAAKNLIRTLIAKDRNGNSSALARRMGVQGIIFDCKAWWSGMTEMGRYSYCFKDNGEKKNNLNPTQAHVDHVHLELNWRGARKRTSFWRSPLG